MFLEWSLKLRTRPMYCSIDDELRLCAKQGVCSSPWYTVVDRLRKTSKRLVSSSHSSSIQTSVAYCGGDLAVPNVEWYVMIDVDVVEKRFQGPIKVPFQKSRLRHGAVSAC